MPSILFNLTLFDYLLFILLVACIVYLHYQQIRLRKLLPYKSSSKKTKILSVVAGENVDTSSIERALYSTELDHNLLSYDAVSQESVMAEIGKGVTIFEIATHGLNGAFRLGNKTLPIAWLAQVLSINKTVECVLLLYCNSSLDLEIINQQKRTAVGLDGEVTDSNCVIFSRNFYFYLNKQFTYRESFDRARLSLPVEDYSKFIFCDGRKA